MQIKLGLFRWGYSLSLLQVQKDGTYVSRVQNKKLSYSAMVAERAYIIGFSGNELAQACTIATRYSTVRRQSQLQHGWVQWISNSVVVMNRHTDTLD